MAALCAGLQNLPPRQRGLSRTPFMWVVGALQGGGRKCGEKPITWRSSRDLSEAGRGFSYPREIPAQSSLCGLLVSGLRDRGTTEAWAQKATPMPSFGFSTLPFRCR